MLVSGARDLVPKAGVGRGILMAGGAGGLWGLEELEVCGVLVLEVQLREFD